MGWVGYSSPSFPSRRSVRGASRGRAAPLVGYLALGWVVPLVRCVALHAKGSHVAVATARSAQTHLLPAWLIPMFSHTR